MADADHVDTEGRYAEALTIKAADLALCMQCGCLVGNRAWHDVWHYDVEVNADEQ